MYSGSDTRETLESRAHGPDACGNEHAMAVGQKTPERKGRVVVDIQGLNKITVPDIHPLPLQEDVFTAVQGCIFISVVNCSGQLPLLLVRGDHIQRFTVTSHRGSQHFNVAIMGFKNSVPYIQRKIDPSPRPYRDIGQDRKTDNVT